MISIDGSYEDCLVINKSKFLSFAFPVFSELEAKEKLNMLRNKYNDATHVCSAYSLSSPKLEKADDDGEPSGTAGKPLLELIKKKGLDNVLLVVVRYFGGIKLGAGGLVRAYTNSGNIVIDKAQIVTMLEIDEYEAQIEIALGSKFQETIRILGGNIVSCLYGENVKVIFTGVDKSKVESMYPSVKINKVGSRIVCQK